MDTANKAYCTNCQTSAGRQKFVREYGSKGARVPGFCKAETANHNILKVWTNPIRLPETRGATYKASSGRAAAYNNLGPHGAPKETDKVEEQVPVRNTVKEQPPAHKRQPSNVKQQLNTNADAKANKNTFANTNHPACGQCSHGCLSGSGF